MCWLCILLILVGLTAPAASCYAADAPGSEVLHEALPEGARSQSPTPTQRFRVHDAVAMFIANPSRATWNRAMDAVELGPPDSDDTAYSLVARYHVARSHRDFPNSLALKKGADPQKHSRLLRAHVEAIFPKLVETDSPALWKLLEVMAVQSFHDPLVWTASEIAWRFSAECFDRLAAHVARVAPWNTHIFEENRESLGADPRLAPRGTPRPCTIEP